MVVQEQGSRYDVSRRLTWLVAPVECGRGFDANFNDSLNVVINEAAARAIGVDDPVGLKLSTTNPQGQGAVPPVTIVGVLKDYNFFSLHSEVGPLVMFYGGNNFNSNVLAVRVNSTNLDNTISNVTEIWDKFSTQLRKLKPLLVTQTFACLSLP